MAVTHIGIAAAMLSVVAAMPAAAGRPSFQPRQSYEAFCQNNAAERQRLFRAMSADEKTAMARAQLEHWRNANRARLTAIQVALIDEVIAKAVPLMFSTAKSADDKAYLEALELRLESSLSKDDVEMLDEEWPAGPCATPTRAIEKAYAAYAAGDDLAVERWLATVGPFDLDEVEKLLTRPASWDRTKAAFVLEAAVVMPHRGRAANLLQAGRAMVVSRPAALGVNPVEDRFEILWHQVALGVLLDGSRVLPQREYLDAIAGRFIAARRQGIALETRFPLVEAMVEATVCCWTPVSGALFRDIPRSLRRGASLESALARFDQAARMPGLGVEAVTRGAVLLHEAGRHADALAWFDRLPPGTDAGLGYVTHLARARSLELAGRPAGDTVPEYRAALAAAPMDQRAGIGLAAALLRAGRAAEALAVADDVRRAPDASTHGLSFFQRADARYIPQWLGEIRRLRR